MKKLLVFICVGLGMIATSVVGILLVTAIRSLPGSRDGTGAPQLQRTLAAEIPSGCSFVLAHHLNSQAYELNKGINPVLPARAEDVLCQDYERYRIIIFPESAGSDFGSYGVYQERTPKNWKKLQSIGLDNSERLSVDATGDLIAESGSATSSFTGTERAFPILR
jgi:hypothetical protein